MYGCDRRRETTEWREYLGWTPQWWCSRGCIWRSEGRCVWRCWRFAGRGSACSLPPADGLRLSPPRCGSSLSRSSLREEDIRRSRNTMDQSHNACHSAAHYNDWGVNLPLPATILGVLRKRLPCCRSIISPFSLSSITSTRASSSASSCTHQAKTRSTNVSFGVLSLNNLNREVQLLVSGTQYIPDKLLEDGLQLVETMVILNHSLVHLRSPIRCVYIYCYCRIPSRLDTYIIVHKSNMNLYLPALQTVQCLIEVQSIRSNYCRAKISGERLRVKLYFNGHIHKCKYMKCELQFILSI